MLDVGCWLVAAWWAAAGFNQHPTSDIQNPPLLVVEIFKDWIPVHVNLGRHADRPQPGNFFVERSHLDADRARPPGLGPGPRPLNLCGWRLLVRKAAEGQLIGQHERARPDFDRPELELAATAAEAEEARRRRSRIQILGHHQA